MTRPTPPLPSRARSLPALMLLAAALTLGACSSPDDAGGPDTGAAPGKAGGGDLASCNAAHLAGGVGGPLVGGGDTPPTQGPYILSSDLPSPHRIVPMGGMVTQDLRPNRLTVWLNGSGRVERLTCG